MCRKERSRFLKDSVAIHGEDELDVREAGEEGVKNYPQFSDCRNNILSKVILHYLSSS